MTNPKLKEFMKEQIATISDDVQKKIDYLQNGQMFSYNYYKIDIYRQKLSFGQDNTLLNAFINTSSGGETDNKGIIANAFSDINSQAGGTTSQNYSSEDLTVKERISKLNSKLAALRGLSMPGDYLHKQ